MLHNGVDGCWSETVHRVRGDGIRGAIRIGRTAVTIQSAVTPGLP